jgi:hypothetical protein
METTWAISQRKFELVEFTVAPSGNLTLTYRHIKSISLLLSTTKSFQVTPNIYRANSTRLFLTVLKFYGVTKSERVQGIISVSTKTRVSQTATAHIHRYRIQTVCLVRYECAVARACQMFSLQYGCDTKSITTGLDVLRSERGDLHVLITRNSPVTHNPARESSVQK